MTDQQHAGMMSCAGNEHLKTPAMDSLAATGVRFQNAFCANPVCTASRVSMLTGRMPSYYGVQSNEGWLREEFLPRADRGQTLGSLFKRAGYETVYGGKVHLPTGLVPLDEMGFRPISTDERMRLARTCAELLLQKRDRPLLMVASFTNPHDIGFMAAGARVRLGNPDAPPQKPPPPGSELALALKAPDGVSRQEFLSRLCPPLPPNFEIPEHERNEAPKPGDLHGYLRRHWTQDDWRLYRWAYCRLTEQVDSEIAVVLKAVRDAGLEEQTLIVFSSDHGDMDAAHRMQGKCTLYEESVRVPFIVSLKGVTRPGHVDRAHLVSSGLDLLPTLCDFAGIEPPKSLPGRSVRALAEGREVTAWREYVVTENWRSRMVRTARYKYNCFDSAREQLFDLENDPGETVDLAASESHREIVAQHRNRLLSWRQEVGDTFPVRVPKSAAG